MTDKLPSRWWSDYMVIVNGDRLRFGECNAILGGKFKP